MKATIYQLLTAHFLAALVMAPCNAATYYVDAVAGNDGNSGQSADQALRSVSGVNGLSLAGGDEVRFRAGQQFDGNLTIDDNGTSASPILISAFGAGNPPVLYAATIFGDYVEIDGLNFDHRKEAGDTLRFRNGRSCVLRNAVLRNGTQDGIDASDADGLLIEDVEIHHFLNGSFGSEDDAHGIVVTGTNGVTIRRANIHHVSGDSFQTDPNRSAGNISTNIVIEDSVLWTSPLSEDFNSGWRTGNSPGENAIDTKVLTSGFDSEARMAIRLTNVIAHGWTEVPQISNRAAFNLKEKIDASMERVTVYDSEIAFRIRGALGNANTTIVNTVIYDVGTAIRAEDNLASLNVWYTTFGDGIGSTLDFAGGNSGTDSWDWRNNAFIPGIPSVATDTTNVAAQSADFVSSANRDYGLTATSDLIDSAASISTVSVDRTGAGRVVPHDIGAYEYGAAPVTRPEPPVLDTF